MSTLTPHYLNNNRIVVLSKEILDVQYKKPCNFQTCYEMERYLRDEPRKGRDQQEEEWAIPSPASPGSQQDSSNEPDFSVQAMKCEPQSDSDEPRGKYTSNSSKQTPILTNVTFSKSSQGFDGTFTFCLRIWNRVFFGVEWCKVESVT